MNSAKPMAVVAILALSGVVLAQDGGHPQNAAALYDSGQWTEALREVRLGLNSELDEIQHDRLRALEGWCLLRLALEQDGSLEEARLSFERAMGLSEPDPPSRQVHLGYGICRLELGVLRRSDAAMLRESIRDGTLDGAETDRERRRLVTLEKEAGTHLEVAARHFEALVNDESFLIEALVRLMETRVLQENPQAAERIGSSALDRFAETQAYWRFELEKTNVPGYARELDRQLQASLDREIAIREAMVGVHLALGAEDRAFAEVLYVLALAPQRPLQVHGILALRHGSTPDEEAILALVRVIERAEGDAGARAEAVTTLGIIGPPAKDAIPILETLAEHDDPQLAERAKAALKQIQGDGQP